MKRLLTSLCALLICSSLAFAREPEAKRPIIRYGVEWGYGVNFFHAWRYNYLDEIDARAWGSGAEFQAKPNAYANLHIGADLTHWLNLSLFTGIMGLTQGREVVPLGLNTKFLPEGTANDGFLFALEGGIGIPRHSAPPIHFLAISSGYRFRLSLLWNMDLFVMLSYYNDKPPLFDEHGNPIQESQILKSYAGFGSVKIGFAINF